MHFTHRLKHASATLPLYRRVRLHTLPAPLQAAQFYLHNPQVQALLILLAGTLHLLWVAGLGSGGWLPAMATSALPGLVVGYALLAVLAAWRRMWVGAAGMAALLVAGWVQLAPYAISSHSGPAQVAGGPAITVLQANLLLTNRDTSSLAQFIHTAQADVVCLQEYTYRHHRALAPALAAQYPWRYTLPQNGAYGLAIYSRHPITQATQLPLQGKPAQDTLIDTGHGTIRLVNLHLENPVGPGKAYRRNRQYAQLEQMLAQPERATASMPLLLCGDYNTVPWDVHMRSLKAAAGLADGRAAYQASWPHPIAFIPIDYVLYRGMQVLPGSVRTVTVPGSDHRAVLGTYML